MQREWLLEEYGRTLTTVQRKYKEFVKAGEEPPVYPAEPIVAQAILGRKEFPLKETCPEPVEGISVFYVVFFDNIEEHRRG